jgi:hypothetical protein
MEFKYFIMWQNLRLVDRLDLFEISNLVYDGREIVKICIAAYRDS